MAFFDHGYVATRFVTSDRGLKTDNDNSIPSFDGYRRLPSVGADLVRRNPLKAKSNRTI
jgi:hypothetical protein